jgi:hypothetical protein
MKRLEEPKETVSWLAAGQCLANGFEILVMH